MLTVGDGGSNSVIFGLIRGRQSTSENLVIDLQST
jgi:hypothetical protein